MSSENTFGKVIYSYTRKQAIEDGVLIDLGHIAVIREHWKFPVACTAEVWGLIERALLVEGQDVNGIAHDISVMAKMAVRKSGDGDALNFEVIIVGLVYSLKLHLGPGDGRAPVLTLLFPNQD